MTGLVPGGRFLGDTPEICSSAAVIARARSTLPSRRGVVSWPFVALPDHPGADARIIRVLEDHGYVVLLRHSTWWECLLERGVERWNGSGASEAGALDDALRCALPSVLGRALLAQARATSTRTREQEDELELEVEDEG